MHAVVAHHLRDANTVVGEDRISAHMLNPAVRLNVAPLPDGFLVTPEHPELNIKHIARVIVRKGLKPVEAKKSISLRVDAEVLAWFQAQDPGYQTRMNAVLKAFKDASP